MNNKFETFKENIINWYPFFENARILVIDNESNEVLKRLNEFSNEVTSITALELDKQEDAFDYILLFSDNTEIENVKKFLKEEGKILIITDNDFGITSFSNASKEGKIKLEKAKKNINTVIEKLKENDFVYQNIYLCFPNKENIELILNAKENLNKEQIQNYTPQIPAENIKLFDEIAILKNMIKYNKKLFNQMSNSYLIEASKKDNISDISYVSFNNCRKEKYRLITKITSNNVEKIPANEIAKSHLEKMKENIEILNQEQIKLLDYVEDNKIYSKFEKEAETLDNILAQYYNDLDNVVEKLNDIKEILINKSISYEKVNFDNARKIIKDMDEKERRKLHFLENAFWDMIPKNCFFKNNEYVFFDQEWREKYLPVEFIIYRSVINSYELVKKIDVNELFNKLEIQEYINTFKLLDEEIRDEIIDNEIYEQLYKNENKAIDNLINDNSAYRDNDKKQTDYIKQLEDDNKKKQEYIEILEKQNKEKQKVIDELSKKKKNYFHFN